MRTRLKDVAAKLSLSPALVSGVLNNNPQTWASKETRDRIFDAASELNYHPSAAAQALIRGKTNSIAFVYRRLESSWHRLAYSGLLDALSAELQRAGLDLTVANFATQEEVLAHLSRLASSRACDAVVLWGREEDTEAQAELLQTMNFPFVVKGRHERLHPDWPQVDFDHEYMMSKAVDHLIDLGHSRIAYIGFATDEGFVQGLKSGFVKAHERRLGGLPSPNLIGSFEDKVEPVANQIRAWLSGPDGEAPTAFAMGAGNAAWQALEQCLAEIGCRLSLNSDGFAAAGVTSSPFTLMFGEALAYQQIEVERLARFVQPALEQALAGSDSSEKIYRLRPELTEALSLRIRFRESLPLGEPR